MTIGKINCNQAVSLDRAGQAFFFDLIPPLYFEEYHSPQEEEDHPLYWPIKAFA